MPEITQKSARSATTSPSDGEDPRGREPGPVRHDPLRLEAAGEPVVEALVSARRVEVTPAGASRPARGLQLAIVPSNLHGAYDPAVALEMVDTWWTRPASRRVAAAIVGPEGVRERAPAGAAGPGASSRSRRSPSRSWRSPRSSPSRRARRARRAGRPPSGGVRVGRAGRRHAAPPALARVGPARVRAGRRPAARGRACPSARRRVASTPTRGTRCSGELIAAATGIPHPDYVHQAVFEPLGMDAFLGLPDHEDARALEVHRAGHVAAGPPALQLARVAPPGDRRGRRVRDGRGLRAHRPGAPGGAARRCIAPETSADMARVQFPGLAGGIESFQTWDVADWGLGCDIRDAKEPHWLPAACSPGDPLALRRLRHAHVGRPGRARRARVPGQPGHVLGLDDASRAGWADLSEAVLREAA